MLDTRRQYVCGTKGHGCSLPRARNGGAGLEVPARDLALGARVKVRGEGLLERLVLSPLVCLGHGALVRVGEQALRALDVIVRPLQHLEHGDGIVQTGGR